MVKVKDNDERQLSKMNLLIAMQNNRPQNDFYSDDILSNFKNDLDPKKITNEFDIKWPPKQKPEQDKEIHEENSQSFIKSDDKKELRTSLNFNNKSVKSKNQKTNLIEASIEQQIWKQMEIMGKHVIYQSLTEQLERYKLASEDLCEDYSQLNVSHYLNEITQFIQNWEDSNEPLTYSSSFSENIYTGDKFITVEQNQTQISQEDDKQLATIDSLIFFKFDVTQKKFIIVGKQLQDVLISSKHTKNLKNKVLNLGYHQYYFRKNINNDEIKQLQLFSFNFKKASDFDFLGGRDYEKDYIIKKRDFCINLPADIEIDLKNIDYCFLQDCNQNVTVFNQQTDKNTVQKQYVLVKSRIIQEENNKNQIVLIYSLKDSSNPILRFHQGEIEDICQGYFTKKDDKTTIFTLKSYQGTHYEIEYFQNDEIKNTDVNGQEYSIHKDSRIKTGKIPFVINTQLNPKCQIFHFEATLNDKKFNQSYSLLSNGQIDLIYPFQSQDKPPLDKQQEEEANQESNYDIVLKQIQKQLGIDGNSIVDQWAVFYYNQKAYQFKVIDEIKSFLKDIGLNISLHDKLKKFNMIMTKELIVCQYYTGILDVYYFDQNQIQGFFQDSKAQVLGDYSNKTLLNMVLEQFDWKNKEKRKVYQDNYNYDNNKNYVNQYLDSFYMNKDKQKVFSTHNKVYVNDQVFHFDQGSVVIDLSNNCDDDQDRFYLIDLYSEQVKDVKLVKYHRSETNILFVFMHRNYTRFHDELNTKEFSGVFFFVLIKVQEIKINSNNNIYQGSILNEGTVIYIPMELDNFVKTFYSNHEIIKYEKNSQSIQGIFTSNLLEFETIRDFKDPTNQWLPFIFHHNVSEGRFELYMCFFNIEDIQVNYQNQDNEEDQINFSNYIQAFKMDYYQSSSDPFRLKDVSTIIESDSQQYRQRVLQLGPRALGKFCRCSNWMRTVEYSSSRKYYDQYSARFQIGSNVNFGLSPLTIEFKEFLVTFDNKGKIMYNVDQKVFKDPSFKENELNSNIFITQIQQRYAIRSEPHRKKKIESSKFTPVENDRLIPNLDDDGNINSSFLLMNVVQTQDGIYQITDSIDKLKSAYQQDIQVLQNLNNQMQKIESINSDFNSQIDPQMLIQKVFDQNAQLLNDKLKQSFYQLKEKLGQYFVVKKIDGTGFTGVFSDGQEISNIDLEIIQDIQDSQEQQEEHNIVQNEEIEEEEKDEEEDEKEEKNSLNKRKNPEFVYDLIELKDSDKNEHNISTICGPLVKFNTKIFSFLNQPNNRVYLCSVMFFNNDVVVKKYFDKKESIYWLYHYSKILLSTSLPNFYELISSNLQKRIDRYFQPRFILNSQNYCNIDFELFSTNISRLKEAFQACSQNSKNYGYLENTVIHLSIMEKQNFKLEQLRYFVNLFKIDSFFFIQYDFMHLRSIIERAIDKKYFKAVTFLVDYMLHPENSNYSFQAFLMTDLPQLMNTDQVNINEFFNINFQEQNVIYQQIMQAQGSLKNIQNQPLGNFEQFLSNKSLPDFGTEETETTFIKDYKGPFWTKDEICQILIGIEQQKEQEKIKELEKKRNKDLDEDETTESLVPISFSAINFQPVLRKIKIDKILQRKVKRSKNTEYLNLFSNNPKKINSVNDLILASLIAQQFKNPDFMIQTTAEKIILQQFETTKPFHQGMLLTYLFGFFIPFCYNCYLIAVLNDKDDSLVSKIEKDISLIFYFICTFTQILFAVFEFAQLKYSGLHSYLSDWWNLFDCSQFIGYFIHISIRLSQGSLKYQFGLYKVFDCTIQLIILCQALTKILYLIRYKDEYSFLVQMVAQVASDLVPFIVFLMMFIFLFALVTIIMNEEISSDGDDSFNNLPLIIRTLIQIFRNSIGDIALPNYGQWNNPADKADDFQSAQPFAFFIIWFFWLSNLFLMLIVLLNFLIAKVGQTYEDVNERGQSFLNLQKAELSLFVFQILQLFGFKNEYIAITFKQQLASNLESGQNEEFASLAESIKKSMGDQIKTLKKELILQNNQLNEVNKNEIKNLKEILIDVQRQTIDIQVGMDKRQAEVLSLLNNQN